ncbi:TetR/AcrR family transcriptional regulator [Sulfitobacter mediterraneus]|uniref:TetR/AcrR family transcriptional regulator n=1 Tax=Sulfitobacter mediterraneus TaxID=83219 RepID=UPI0024909666|nr:TetR/AcrR family transcriptional regulator [Sulfitobacter mediterraneus]
MDSLVADKYRQQMVKHSDAIKKTDNELSKSERTRGEILAAAARLFRHEGYYATTMRDIAQESGIEAGSIYYHFGSKDQILSEVLDIGVRALHGKVSEIIQSAKGESKGFRETFAQLIETHLTYLLTTSDYTSANIRNYPMLTDEARAPHRDLRASYARIWSEFLERAKEANLLRKDISVSTIRQFVLSAMNWTVEWYDVERYPVQLLAGRMSNLILDGMCSHYNADTGGQKMSSDIAFRAPEIKGKAAKTRADILLAAARMLRDNGYKATTLRQIAEEADMKAGSVYYHFESKEAIVDEVLNAGLSDLLSGVSAAADQFDAPYDHHARIATAIWTHMHFLFQASEFTSANIRSYGMLPNQFREKHGKIRHEYGKLWDSILRDAQNDDAIRSDIKIVPLRQVMLGALNWTVEWFDPNRAGVEGNLSLPEFSEMLIKLLLEGICDRENATGTKQAELH